MFSDSQEMDVGDAIAEHVQREFLVIDDPDYTGYVQRVGQKLLDHAPPTELRVQFFLSDLPVANALSLPGGRVYVSRKLVAMARNEDELAGILGHELGHVLTHQPVTKVSQLFRDVLGVSQPGSREEIFKHYADLQDNIVRKHRTFDRGGGEDKQDQLIADQIGMQLVANSGYKVQAFGEIFDRIAETKGKTGNWLSDLFGATSSESKRLREILKQAPTLACSASAAPASPEEFQKWRASVVAYSGLGHKEQLTDVIARVTINPPLQSELRRIRFSLDGSFLLAQNESTIFVIDAASFTPKFSIYAPSAYDASFSPDSQSVVFYNPTFRVEIWSVADQARISASETVIIGGCVQSRLSPDGHYLACLNPEYDLALYDTENSSQVFVKKHFYEPSWTDYFFLLFARLLEEGNIDLLHMRFSPDARYFVVHSPREEFLAVNLANFQQIPLAASLRKLLSSDFDFVGSDKIVGVDNSDRKNSGIVKFPGGESVLKLTLGSQSLESASNSRYLLLRPIAEHPLGIMDVETGKIVAASEKRAGDVLGQTYVHERVDGDLGSLDFATRQEARRAKLPLGELGDLQAVSVSPDLRWLALSGKSRGAEWDLLQNQRIFYVRGFKGASVGPDGVAEIDVQKFEKTERHLVHLDPSAKALTAGMDLEKAEGSQYGSVFVRTKHNGKENWKWRDISFEVLDARSGTMLWWRTFPKEAPNTVSRRKESLLVFSWPANSDGAREEIRNNPVFSRRWSKIDADSNDYFLEALEPRTGKIVGATILRTGKGSFTLSSAEAAGKFLVAADSANRLHVISLESGEQKGLLFGRRPALSTESALLGTENDRGELSLYDLNTMTRQQQYFFTHPVTYVAFGADQRRMLVLTGDQTVFHILLPKAAAPAAVATANH